MVGYKALHQENFQLKEDNESRIIKRISKEH